MTDAKVRFTTTMRQTGANTTGVVVPPDAIAELGGGARPAVVAEINDYSYRTTVGVMRGQSMLPFSAQHREASGIVGGDEIEVALQLDDKLREADMPEELAAALAEAGGLEPAFRKQAPSRQRADVEAVTSAKTPETRARRIEAIVERLRA
jgi:hypothetical protein